MSNSREGGLEADVQKRFKALFALVEGVGTAPPRNKHGVTDDGRYAYRYDDEGRFYATPMRQRIRQPFEAWPD